MGMTWDASLVVLVKMFDIDKNTRGVNFGGMEIGGVFAN